MIIFFNWVGKQPPTSKGLEPEKPKLLGFDEVSFLEGGSLPIFRGGFLPVRFKTYGY